MFSVEQASVDESVRFYPYVLYGELESCRVCMCFFRLAAIREWHLLIRSHRAMMPSQQRRMMMQKASTPPSPHRRLQFRKLNFSASL